MQEIIQETYCNTGEVKLFSSTPNAVMKEVLWRFHTVDSLKIKLIKFERIFRWQIPARQLKFQFDVSSVNWWNAGIGVKWEQTAWYVEQGLTVYYVISVEFAIYIYFFIRVEKKERHKEMAEESEAPISDMIANISRRWLWIIR